jgi:hypothetical protein
MWENPFELNPLEVGNPMTLGLMEETELENRVRAMIKELRYYGLCVPAYLVTQKLEEYGIPYDQLPQYLINEIDELEVY